MMAAVLPLFLVICSFPSVARGRSEGAVLAARVIANDARRPCISGSRQCAAGHIHLAQTGVNGGITVFLCTNLGNGPAGTQGCPPTPATITGTIFAADVSPEIPATAPARIQGLGTGEFAELLAAIRAGAT